ncbi:MAG: thioredoxin fold domain-containing protein [Agarilytica sp.]
MISKPQHIKKQTVLSKLSATMTVQHSVRFLMLCLSVLSVSVFAVNTYAGKLNFDTLDFPRAEKAMTNEGKPLVLYISQTGCLICKRLERDVLSKVLKNNDYLAKISLQKTLWDSPSTVTWINNTQTLPDTIAQHYEIAATPTLLFLDNKGNEIAKRIVGYVNDDFYWDYLDKRIEKAQKVLASKSALH